MDKYHCSECGKKITVTGKTGLCVSCIQKGSRNFNFGKSWGRKGPLEEKTRRKLSEAHKGKVLSEEHKKVIGKSNKGKNFFGG